MPLKEPGFYEIFDGYTRMEYWNWSVDGNSPIFELDIDWRIRRNYMTCLHEILKQIYKSDLNDLGIKIWR